MDLKNKVELLNKEQKEKYEKLTEEKEEKIKEELKEKYREKIQNQIEEDLKKLKTSNIIISAFLNQENTDYSFIRTKPLPHKKKKSFDILISSKNKKISILIKCEPSLTSNLSKKINEFQAQKDIIKENKANKVNIDNYFSTILNYQPNEIEYVISSQKLSDKKLDNEAKKRETNLISWEITYEDLTWSIQYKVSKNNKKTQLQGHKDQELIKYIQNELGSEFLYKANLDYINSSKNYLKLKNSIIAIINNLRGKNEKTFNYKLWKNLFKIELLNYQEKEKKTLYKNFIENSLKYELIIKEKDKEQIFKNKYRIKTKSKRNTEKLEKEIINKIAEHEITEEKELKRKIKSARKKIVQKLLDKQQKTKITDFMNKKTNY